jgi:putative FmdB family regulatory protein
MPTYQYACTSCGEELEAVQKFSDDPLTTCPACAGTLRKVFTAVGVVFKGSGFYKTDSRAKSGAKPGADAGKGKEKETSKDTAAAGEGGSKKAASSGESSAGGSADAAKPATGGTATGGSSGDRVA